MHVHCQCPQLIWLLFVATWCLAGNLEPFRFNCRDRTSKTSVTLTALALVLETVTMKRWEQKEAKPEKYSKSIKLAKRCWRSRARWIRVELAKVQRLFTRINDACNDIRSSYIFRRLWKLLEAGNARKYSSHAAHISTLNRLWGNQGW